MFIDGIVVGLLVLAIFKGLRKGFVLAIFSFLGLVIGLAAALKLSALVAGYLGKNISISERWLPFVAFALVFFGVVLLVRLGAKMIEGGLELAMLGWLNKLGGILFFALLYLFVCSVLLFYAVQLQLLQPEALAGSVAYPMLAPLGPKIMEGLGAMLPFFKGMFTTLAGYFEALTTTAPR